MRVPPDWGSGDCKARQAVPQRRSEGQERKSGDFRYIVVAEVARLPLLRPRRSDSIIWTVVRSADSRRRLMRCPFAVAVLLSLASQVHADDWPQFRGPNGQGLAQ